MEPIRTPKTRGSQSRIITLALPLGMLAITLLAIIPVPAPLLDVLLAMSIAASVATFLMVLNVSRPLEFSVFPVLLLMTTLLRLGLSVRSTVLILGQGSAGSVIHSFGSFLIGGSLIVGLAQFLVVMVIGFLVITKGSERASEVAARFALDGLPGKQMAIDADLAAGAITHEEAQERRSEIQREVDFYGRLDGAAKVIKGDAIATVIIVLISLLGGFAIGVLQKGMSVGEAVMHYSLLSVGDGLVAQVPALLSSFALSVLVARTSTPGPGGSDVSSQLLAQWKNYWPAVRLAGIAMIIVALVPGMPKIPFLFVGGVLVFASRRIRPTTRTVESTNESTPETHGHTVLEPEEIAAGVQPDAICLELAVDLVDLVGPESEGRLRERAASLRETLASNLGVVLPHLRVRDNLDRPPTSYAILIHGVEVATGESPPGVVLAIGDDLSMVPGVDTVDPAYGMPAKWVPDELAAQAQLSGALVVDRTSVIVTHLQRVLQAHASELLSAESVKLLVDAARHAYPATIQELDDAVHPAELRQVLQGLLAEQVPVRDLVSISAALSEFSLLHPRGTVRSAEQLVEAARVGLGAQICQQVQDLQGEVPVIMLEASLDQALAAQVTQDPTGVTFFKIDQDVRQALLGSLLDAIHDAQRQGMRPVVLVNPVCRPAMHRMIHAMSPEVPVLSFEEVQPPAAIRPVCDPVILQTEAAQ